jgi:D-alanine-D-alanine ligase
MIKVGVLRGGPSSEFEVSLKTGQSVLDNFHEDFDAYDIFIDKSGNWFLDGLAISPEQASKKFDVFFNCLHGSYGEDGKVQQILDSYNTPYTGSGPMASAMAMNKFLTKRTYVINGLRVPDHESLSVSHDLDSKLSKIFTTWLMPVVIKPSNGGSSVGVSLAYTLRELHDAVSKAFNYSNEIIIEEYIRGKEATCGVLENFRNEDLYALLPVEIVKPKKSTFFDYDAKYSGETEEIVPGRFSKEESKEIQRLARLAHNILGLRHYSRSDFIVSPHGVYILETNTLPGLTTESLYPRSLEAIGSNLNELTGHLVNLALDR